MTNKLLDSKLNLIRLNNKLGNMKKLVRGKSCGFIVPQLVSKFGSEMIKSDLELKLPMKTKIRFFRDGESRDGIMKSEDFHDAAPKWVGKDIIDWHDLSDMKNPTDYKMGDIKGYIGDTYEIVQEGNTLWIEAEAYITNRDMAYLIYIKERNGEKIEVSPEFTYSPYIGTDGKRYQTNIRPDLLTLVKKGHLEGNFMKVVET